MQKSGKRSISIRELHEKTGALVRLAGASRIPFVVTDRGKAVAMLAAPEAIAARKRPKPVLLPEYVKAIAELPVSTDVSEALDEVRER